MAGVTFEAVPKRFVSYDGLDLGSQEIILADKVEVLQWRKLTLLVKVYGHSLASGAGNIVIGAYPQTASVDDPNLEFIERTVLYGPTIDASVVAPAYFTTGLPVESLSCFGPLLRVVAFGTRLSPGAMSATVSVDVSAKDA
jgi:hypothetical protein